MKRKVLLFILVLIVMLLLKKAFGQEAHEGTVTWDPASCWDCSPADLQTLAAQMVLAPIAGAFYGFVRVLGLRRARPALEPLRLK